MTTKKDAATIRAAIKAGMQRAKSRTADDTKPKKMSGAQRRREARERDALAQQPVTVVELTPASLLDAILDETAFDAAHDERSYGDPYTDDVDAAIAAEKPAAPVLPAVGPKGVPNLDAIRDAAKKAADEKAAKKAKRAPKPKTDPKSYHAALSSLSRMNQRDIHWRAGDAVKREKFATYELALASIFVNMRADVLDKYDGGYRVNGSPAPIVDAPSVKVFLAGLAADVVAGVTRQAKPKTARGARKSGDANALAIAFAGELVDTVGAVRALRQLDSMLTAARTKHPERVAHFEAAVAEAKRIADTKPAAIARSATAAEKRKRHSATAAA